MSWKTVVEITGAEQKKRRMKRNEDSLRGTGMEAGRPSGGFRNPDTTVGWTRSGCAVLFYHPYGMA